MRLCGWVSLFQDADVKLASLKGAMLSIIKRA